MATLTDYAALSAIVYNDVRRGFNVLSPLPGWTEILSNTGGLGFTAGAYKNGNDIVIAFKGTDTILKNATVDWLLGNIPAGLGTGSSQLVEAALFYEAVKAANPGSNITFTGHSLGGGLASVMAVYFDKQATTFDEAPFLLSALNPVFTGVIAARLILNGIVDSDFATFALNPLAVGLRSSNVHDYYVNGEILSYLRNPLTTIYGVDTPIAVGGAALLPDNAVSNAITLHSMNLAAALLMSQTFADDTVLLPNLLKEIFDEQLYSAAPEGAVANFLIHILNDQIKVGYTNANGLLSRFAGDLAKLTNYGANLKDGALGKALIDVAIADYYFMQSGFTKKDFFTASSGGISFDLKDIGTNWSNNKTVRSLNDAFISQYLNNDQTARQFLAQDSAWTIQSGGTALNVTGTGTNNDAMIGGSSSDVLNGGSGNDFLYGGGGADTLTGGIGDDVLTGGTGNDVLQGGTGYDTYVWHPGDGNDQISDAREADGKVHGIIQIDNGQGQNILVAGAYMQQGSSEVWRKIQPDGSAGLTITHAGQWTLTLADGSSLVLRDFQDGDFGINLHESLNITTSRTIVGDLAPLSGSSNQYDPLGYIIERNVRIDALGNVITNTGFPLPTRRDYLYDSAGNDRIQSGGGDDIINSDKGGNDILEGGSGSDLQRRQ